jgi:hypothetical protein
VAFETSVAFETPEVFETFAASETFDVFEAFGVSETSKFWVTVNRVCIIEPLPFSEALACKRNQQSSLIVSPPPKRQMAPKFQDHTSLTCTDSYLLYALTTSAQLGLPFL